MQQPGSANIVIKFEDSLKDCGSGRYFSTESMGFVCGLDEVLSTVIMAE